MFTKLSIAFLGFLVLKWLLGLFGEWFSGINGITKDLWSDTADFVTSGLPQYILFIILPYLLAYTGLALYCIVWRPDSETVEGIRLTIRKTIWGKNA